MVLDAMLADPFPLNSVVASRLDVRDPEFSRVIRRDVRGVVGPPSPPGTVVAHLEAPFVLPERLPTEITDIIGDLKPPDTGGFRGFHTVLSSDLYRQLER